MKLAALIGVALVCGGLPAAADAVQDKLCILQAAAKLPAIQGLEIVGSRNILDQKKPETSVVEIDFKAAGQQGTFTFACAWGQGKPTIVVAGGLAR